MNLPVLVLLFSVIVAFGGSVLKTQLLMTTATHRVLAADAATQGEDQAQAQEMALIRNLVMGNIQSGNDPGSGLTLLGSLQSQYAVQLGSTSYYLSYHASVNDNGTPACSQGSSTSGAGNDTAQNVQCATMIKEQRFSASVRVKLTDSARTQALATKTRFITFRVLRAPPYVLIDGVRENEALLSGNTVADSGAEGDSGGVVGDGTVTDTRIQAVSGCDPAYDPNNNDSLPWGTGSNNHGAVSQTCTYPGYPTPSPAPFGSPGPEQWTNGNANNSQWTP